MSVRHHPDADLLLTYAAGGCDAASALIVATHLNFCALCRQEAGLAARIGGVLLGELPPTPLAPDALARTLARLDDARVQIAAPPASTSGGKPSAPKSDGNTPAPLREFLGRNLSEMRWRRMGPRLAYIPLLRRGGVSMRLLRGAPGTDVGPHRHRGMEYTLVLAGGFTDETGTYGVGDFQTAAPGLHHNPVTDSDGDGDCITLAVTTAPLAFDGLIQKIAARLFGF